MTATWKAKRKLWMRCKGVKGMRLSLITTAATYALRCPSRKRVPLKGVSLSFSLTLSLSLTVRCFIFRLPAHCLAPGAVEEIKKKKKGAIQDAEMLTHTAVSVWYMEYCCSGSLGSYDDTTEYQSLFMTSRHQ